MEMTVGPKIRGCYDFFHGHCTSLHIHSYLSTFSISLSYLILAVPVHKCSENTRAGVFREHSCRSVQRALVQGVQRALVQECSPISGGPPPYKWWSTLKSAVFGSSSSLPPLVGPGGGLVCESVGKADLLSDHFDSKQSRESVDLLVT